MENVSKSENFHGLREKATIVNIGKSIRENPRK